MIAGLALALGSALGTNVAFLFKQRGAVLAPAVQGRHPLRSAVGLFRSRWFALGWAVAVVQRGGSSVGALALAPLVGVCRPFSRAGWCFWPCSPSATSAFTSAADSGPA